MARQLPTIKTGPATKNDLSPKKKFHRSSTMDSNPQKTRLNKLVEARLAKQFQYFRAEFLEHALSIGIPVPLDMVEDKNGKVLTFVNQKGPRYLLNIIHAYPESVHLLRSSLSFLIVIIAILTGKIEYAIEHDQHLANGSHNVYTWASDALTSIADSSSVAICTNLLRHSHSEAIQELILNLLAQLVRASPEAAAQMMHRPQVNASSASSEPQERNCSNPTSPREGGGSAAVSSSDPDSMTCLSYMFSVVSHNRNRYTVMTSCAEVCLALLKDGSEEVSEAMARTWISRLPLVKPTTTLGQKKERYTGREELFEGNKGNTTQLKKIKTLSVLTRKPPTTVLPRKSRGAGGLPGAVCVTPKEQKKEETKEPNPNEWAALKVLLKFLHRFMRYGPSDDDAVATPRLTVNIDDESLGEGSARAGRARARFSQPANAITDKDDIVPHKHKKALYTAHSKVLLVVVEIVSNSSAVAKFILSMPGACAILKASCAMHTESAIGDKVRTCLMKLQGETDALLKKEMTQHHSMSFELTHGKSAKLFNPVSPIARRESAMLSPERCKTAEIDHSQGGNLQLHSMFAMSGGLQHQQENMAVSGDTTDRRRSQSQSQSRGNTANGPRPKSRGNSVMFASTSGGRRPTRAGLIPVSKLFTSKEKKYQQNEEEKRILLEQEKMKQRERDIFDESAEEEEDGVDEEEEEEGEENVAKVQYEDDSWFMNSFQNDDEKVFAKYVFLRLLLLCTQNVHDNMYICELIFLLVFCLFLQDKEKEKASTNTHFLWEQWGIILSPYLFLPAAASYFFLVAPKVSSGAIQPPRISQKTWLGPTQRRQHRPKRP